MVLKVNSMAKYLQRFYSRLKERHAGSLVKVEDTKYIEPNAKEYLIKLTKLGLIEKVHWGWYFIPNKVEDPWDFFEEDGGFKVICCQTAASLWNQDFIHRDAYSLTVSDRSYERALEDFAKIRGWRINVEYVAQPKGYTRIGKLLVQGVNETIIECIQRWAFMDAFAVLYSNRKKIVLEALLKRSYWKRVYGTNIRVRQVLEYGCRLINESVNRKIFSVRKQELNDAYVKREVEEAVEKVVELG